MTRVLYGPRVLDVRKRLTQRKLGAQSFGSKVGGPAKSGWPAMIARLPDMCHEHINGPGHPGPFCLAGSFSLELCSGSKIRWGQRSEKVVYMRTHTLNRSLISWLLLAALAVAAVFSLAHAPAAQAAFSSCRADPLFLLSDGTILDVQVGISTDVKNVDE